MTHRSRKPSPPDETVTIGSASWETLWEQAAPQVATELRREDGWRTVAEEVRRLGIRRQPVQERLRRLVAEGVFERRLGRTKCNVSAYYYRPKIEISAKRQSAKR